MLSSQPAVDLDAGNRNDEKRDNSARNDAYIPQLKACDGRKSKEDGKSPDEGEQCANSPGRHNLLILEVKKQAQPNRDEVTANALKSEHATMFG